jgi:hypothetical protein
LQLSQRCARRSTRARAASGAQQALRAAAALGDTLCALAPSLVRRRCLPACFASRLRARAWRATALRVQLRALP